MFHLHFDCNSFKKLIPETLLSSTTSLGLHLSLIVLGILFVPYLLYFLYLPILYRPNHFYSSYFRNSAAI